MPAAAFCADENKCRILKVYSNDGPGFNEMVVNLRDGLIIRCQPRAQLAWTSDSVDVLIADFEAKKNLTDASLGFDNFLVCNHNPFCF